MVALAHTNGHSLDAGEDNEIAAHVADGLAAGMSKCLDDLGIDEGSQK